MLINFPLILPENYFCELGCFGLWVTWWRKGYTWFILQNMLNEGRETKASFQGSFKLWWPSMVLGAEIKIWPAIKKIKKKLLDASFQLRSTPLEFPAVSCNCFMFTSLVHVHWIWLVITLCWACLSCLLFLPCDWFMLN